jgi:hypothetical protein
MPAPKTHATFTQLLSVQTDQCQVWPHFCNSKGYSIMTHPSGERYAHRAALLETVGPAPEGTEAAHLCGASSCINPRHLRWATPSENNYDRTTHGTMPRGSTHHSTNVTEADVRGMRYLRSQGFTYAEIGANYGMHRASASRILRGKSWAWFTESV